MKFLTSPMPSKPYVIAAHKIGDKMPIMDDNYEVRFVNILVVEDTRAKVAINVGFGVFLLEWIDF